MANWKYRIVAQKREWTKDEENQWIDSVTTSGCDEVNMSLTELLNAMGAKGWELVAVETQNEVTSQDGYSYALWKSRTFFFKQPATRVGTR
jgi:hypothetical protein